MNTKSEAMENRAANITKEREDSDEVRLTQFECKLKETRTIRGTSTTIYREQSNAIRGKNEIRCLPSKTFELSVVKKCRLF